MRTSPNFWVERKIVPSPAFRELSGNAIRILMCFFIRRQVAPVARSGRKGKPGSWKTTNNGKLVFTYLEAEAKYGIPKTSFTRGLDELIEHGFIDVAEASPQLQGHPTLFAFSERWRAYGTDDFKPAARKRGKLIGFCNPKKTGQKGKPKSGKAGGTSGLL